MHAFVFAGGCRGCRLVRMIFRSVLLVVLTCPSSLFAWGDDGHNAIWSVAQSRLSPVAKHRVDAILKGDKLEMTAVWMDRARDAAKGKGGPLAEDADAAAFNIEFKYNSTWHYVDLPLGARSYEEVKEFHGHDNVVTQITAAIKVLQGKLKVMDERTALRVLVHLVGDIHQPMHCGSGFFDISDLKKPVLHTDPVKCLPLEKERAGDMGGNLLFFGPDPFDQLHGYWDVDVPKRVGLLASLADVLTQHIPSVKADTPGTLHEWSAQWAGESVKVAAKAYTKLTFGACTPAAEGGKGGKFERIEISLPADYAEFSKAVGTEQMTKAAIRLADVLNTIWKTTQQGDE